MQNRRRPRVRSYEEDMTPPPGMRRFNPQMTPAEEPPSYEEDMTPPPGLSGFNPYEESRQEGSRRRPRGMAKGGNVETNYNSAESIVGHGKTKAAAKSDYARKMKSAGLKPRGMASGGSVASKRADGCVSRGKTKGRFV